MLRMIGLGAVALQGWAAEPVAKPASTNVTAVAATNAPALKGTNAPAAAGTNAPAQGGVVDAETRELKPHDTFRYRVEQDPTAGADSMRVSITDSGEAHFNVSRGHSTYVTVKAAGRHLAEVKRELKEKLDAEYYKDATVNLDLEGVNNPAAPGGAGLALGSTSKVQVFGEMQGTFPLPEGQRIWLSDVILSMPRNDYADLTKVKVQRTNADGKPETIVVNVDKVLNKNERSSDLELKDGDRIRVPRKIFVNF